MFLSSCDSRIGNLRRGLLVGLVSIQCNRYGLARVRMTVAGHFQRTDEAIAPAGNSLNETRFVGRVVQSIAKFINSIIQVVIEIDKSIIQPQALVKLFARYQLSRTFQKGQEKLKGFLLEL